MKDYKRVAYLTEDATPYKESVQLNYKRRGVRGAFSGPPSLVCPPIETLKAGTKVILTFDYPWGGRVLKVGLAK